MAFSWALYPIFSDGRYYIKICDIISMLGLTFSPDPDPCTTCIYEIWIPVSVLLSNLSFVRFFDET
jgi:hypothetical protein